MSNPQLQTLGLSLVALSLLPMSVPQHLRPTKLYHFLLRLSPFLLLAHLVSRTSLHCPTSLLPKYPIIYSNVSRLLASEVSKTGVVVVGEHQVKGETYRYLRADHSILGGLWVGAAKDALRRERKSEMVEEYEVVRRAESIYVSSHSPPRRRDRRNSSRSSG